MWYIYTMEYYLAIKWDEIVPFAEKHCYCCSVAWSCLTLCDPVDYSMPGFPVHRQLLEPTQTHVLLVRSRYNLTGPSSLSFTY